MKTWSTPVRKIEKDSIPCALCGGLKFKKALICEGFEYVRCRNCGLVQMNPQPLKEEIISRYSDKFGGEYLSYEIENEAAFLKLQQLALKDASFFKLEKIFFLGDKDKPSVLDIGCATGTLLSFLRERGWRVTGVEISPSAEFARSEKKLDVKSLPLEENKFPAESFDAILASHLIEHLNDPCSFLKEVNRVLKKDGLLFITTPDISGFQAKIYKGRWRSAIFDHLYLFSKGTLKKMLIKHGFKIQKVRTWGGLAAGFNPVFIKRFADKAVKFLNNGDVMIIRARKDRDF